MSENVFHHRGGRLKRIFAKILLDVVVRAENFVRKIKSPSFLRSSLRASMSNRRRVLAAALALLVLLGAGFLTFMLTYQSGRTSAVSFIASARGAWAVAQELERNEVIPSSILFRLGVFLIPGRGLRSGEYLIRADDSLADIIATMRRGKSVRYRLTIPEGLTHHQIKEVLRINTLFIGESGAWPEEGVLLPETYFVYRNQRRTSVIARMKRAHHRLVNKLWAARAPDLPLNSAREAVVLASIVEKETGIKGERAHVASVFINRLNRNNYMQLQSDPTVIYALTQGKPLERSLTYNDLKFDSPYNTYANYGLPPGAISNPGRAALEAVMNPAKTKSLFFVADGTGGHAFATTYEEHLRNVAKWRAIQNGGTTSEAADEPAETVPAETVPAKAVPVEAAPVKTVPVKTVPVKTVPAKAVPAEAVPAKAVPVETVPAKAVPAKAVPAEAVPAQAVPEVVEPVVSDSKSSSP